MDKKYIERKYLNTRIKGSFSGIQRFRKEQKLNSKNTLDVLSSIPAYTRHKPAPSRFKRRKVVVHFVNQIYCSDLIDLQKYYRWNSGKKWLCMVMDLFSRYLYAFPLSDKKAESVKKGFQELFRRTKTKPLTIWTDQGQEYLGKAFQDYLKKINVKHYYTYSKLKSTSCERVNRTILSKLFKWMSAAKSKRWIDIIQSIISTYNDEKHRSIGMSPSQARKKQNHAKVQQAMFKNSDNNNSRARLKKGDSVILRKNKLIFAKSYLPQFGDEVFKIYSVKFSNPITYILSDKAGNLIPGSFYEKEIQKVNYDSSN